MKSITLRAARKRAGLTQVELATASGVDQTAISKLEVGTIANPGFDTVLKLANALDVDPRTLRFGQRDSESAA